MIVVDTNVVVQLVVPGDDTEVSVAVLRRDADWAVPPLCWSELRSVLGKCVQRRVVTVDAAVDAMERVSAVVLERGDALDSRAVLELARRSACSTYDCEYVALATALGTRLVTWDRAVLRAFPAIAVTPTAFVR